MTVLALARSPSRRICASQPTFSPLTLGGMAALLLMVALLACWVPARRAMKVDPLVGAAM